MYKLRFNAKQRSMDEFMYEYSTKFNSLDYESNHNVDFTDGLFRVDMQAMMTSENSSEA